MKTRMTLLLTLILLVAVVSPVLAGTEAPGDGIVTLTPPIDGKASVDAPERLTAPDGMITFNAVPLIYLIPRIEEDAESDPVIIPEPIVPAPDKPVTATLEPVVKPYMPVLKPYKMRIDVIMGREMR